MKMTKNNEMMCISSQENSLSPNETEIADRKKQISKCKIIRVLPRHPTQRHCPIRQGPIKRKKRRFRCTSINLPLNQDISSSRVSINSLSLSQTSTSSSSSICSPPRNIAQPVKKRKTAIDKCDGRGETALHKAAIKGDIKLVKSLLRRGANPNHQDYAGWTPLHEACIRGWYNVAQALLKAGANANTPGLHNVTALHDATAWSHISLVKLLLKYGANLTSKNDKGDTPLALASGTVRNYLENHGFIPEQRTNVVPERTDEMRKSTYRSKVVKANSTDVTFKIKVRCEQKSEDIAKHSKKSKKKKSSRVCHSKKNMEAEETKKEVPSLATSETKDGDETNPTTTEELESTSSGTVTVENTEADSRRSSVSLDDEDEGKRNKRRKDKEEHSRKDDSRNKEDHNHKKEDHTSKKEEQQHTHKKEEHGYKKEEHNISSRSKTNTTNSASPKSTSSVDGLEGEENLKNVDSPGPKVPPLKIVIPPAESEQGSRNGKNTTRHHPYVVVSNDETTTAVSTVTTSPSSPAVQTTIVKEEPNSPSSAGNLSNEEQRVQQRVLRSTHSNRGAASNISSNGSSSGANSGTSGSSSPIAPDLSPQQDTGPPKEENKVKNELNLKNKTESAGKSKAETAVKLKLEAEEESKPSPNETRSTTVYHVKEEPIAVEVHPRKRKLKPKQESTHTENDHVSAFGAAPHPHEVPVTNCYQMFMDIRRQIDVKRKGLFPIQPKPPQGFKDYLMNRCTYTLAGNSEPRLKRRNADPPEGIHEGMKELYQEQESDRYSLRMQHVVEKEKLVLSVEQEILRVHGRAARALANQALPFSACTILKDEEVYNVITPEQEEKDRNARSRYNGRLFISWLQDVDDKWEKIKEEMLARHHKEAESLNAIQKFNWDIKMRQLGLWKKKKFVPIDETFVPMLSVSDDFDLLPE